MLTVFVHRNGQTEQAASIDPEWLKPDSGAKLWVDLAAPTPDELTVLTDDFHFHPIAVEDAVAQVHQPKVENFNGYLYLILHGIDYRKAQTAFATHDTDFFLGPTISSRSTTARCGASRRCVTSASATSTCLRKGRRR